MKAVPFVFIVAGVGLIIAAAWNWKKNHDFYSAALHADGRVLELVTVRNNRNVLFAPKVVFTDTAGRSVTFVSSLSSRPPDYHAGGKALVAYDRTNSSHAEVDSFSARWMIVLILGGIGTVMALLGTLLWYSGVMN